MKQGGETGRLCVSVCVCVVGAGERGVGEFKQGDQGDQEYSAI